MLEIYRSRVRGCLLKSEAAEELLPKAETNYKLETWFQDKPSDKGPFYHGTKPDLQVGDLLTSGGGSNFRAELKMNHIYFTALTHGAGLAAALAKVMDGSVFILLNRQGVLKMARMLQTKNFRAIRHAHIAPKLH